MRRESSATPRRYHVAYAAGERGRRKPPRIRYQARALPGPVPSPDSKAAVSGGYRTFQRRPEGSSQNRARLRKKAMVIRRNAERRPFARAASRRICPPSARASAPTTPKPPRVYCRVT